MWENRDLSLVSFPARGVGILQCHQQSIHPLPLLKKFGKFCSLHSGIKKKNLARSDRVNNNLHRYLCRELSLIELQFLARGQDLYCSMG